MSIGERGLTGDHGQSGDAGQVGAKGEKGDRGERGLNPWAVRRANLAYALLAGGLLLSVFLSQWQERQDDARFEAQVTADAKESCVRANEGRTSVNRNREAIRALEIAVRSSYELVVPAPDATDVQRQRVDEFRTRILALLDTVEVDGNLALRDCSVIGNGTLPSNQGEDQ